VAAGVRPKTPQNFGALDGVTGAALSHLSRKRAQSLAGRREDIQLQTRGELPIIVEKLAAPVITAAAPMTTERRLIAAAVGF